MDKSDVYFVAEGVPRLLRNGISIAVPRFVYCEHMLDDRQNSRGTHSYEDIISVENLLAAWREFVAGKREKKDVQEFQHALMDNILDLRRELKEGIYRHSDYHAFKISDPKPRDIHKAMVRDRLVHHAIYRVLYPHFDRKFIADSYSCRDDKGTHRAMDRFWLFGWKVSKNGTRTCWVLKCDIKKFFASIDQSILRAVVAKHITDPRTRALLDEVVESFSSTAPGKGLPLGNLTSQLLVNVYMNEFDQHAKHRLKAHFYIRYADDFVFLSDDRAWLESLIPRIQTFLSERLTLSLHPNKVSIGTLAAGVDFLGWVHFPDHRVLRGATKRRMIRTLAEERSEPRLQSYRGLLSHGNAKKLSTAHLQKSKNDVS